MTHKFQKHNQTIRLAELENKFAMLEILALMQEMPKCSPKECGAYLKGQCQITGEQTDETKICIPESRSVER